MADFRLFFHPGLMSFGKVYLASQKTLVNASQYFRIYHVKLIGRKGMAQFFEPVPKLIDCSLNAHGFGTASFDNIFNGFIINAESLEKMFFEKKSVIFTTKISEQGNKVRIDVFLMSDFGIDSTGNLAEFLRIVNNENEGFPQNGTCPKGKATAHRIRGSPVSGVKSRKYL